MDIRFINRKNEIINATKLSIKVMNKWLIGITAEQKIVEIEKYEDEEKAEEILKEIAKEVSEAGEVRGIVIDLRK